MWVVRGIPQRGQHLSTTMLKSRISCVVPSACIAAGGDSRASVTPPPAAPSSQQHRVAAASVAYARHTSGAFRATPPRLLMWGYKTEDLHRLARDRPWWENLALLIGAIGVVLLSSGVYYFGNRLYYCVRPAGNDLIVIQRLDEKVFSRPDLSVTLVRMTIHHLLSKTETPFGAPMVAPPELKREAMELLGFIKDLHKEQPQFSIPDLWVIAVAKAIERLGGPAIPALRGRNHVDVSDDAKLLTFPQSLLKDDERDVLKFKKLFALQHIGCDEAIATLAAFRNLGYHLSLTTTPTGEMKPANPREKRVQTIPSEETKFAQRVETKRKCSMDPYVFGGEYFNHLLDYQWKPVPAATVDKESQSGAGDSSSSSVQRVFSWLGLGTGTNKSSSGRGTVWVCSENNRRRVEFLVNPLSQEFLNESKKRQDLNAKEIRDLEEAAEADRREHGDHRGTPTVSPCDHVSLEAVDVMLLDDALTVGWLHKFSDNELRFYNTFAKVTSRIFAMGYNENELFNLRT